MSRSSESEAESRGGEEVTLSGGRGGSLVVLPAARVWGLALLAGILAGGLAWKLGELTLTTFKPPMTTINTPAGPMVGATASEQLKADKSNTVVVFAVLGAVLAGALGIAGGLVRSSAALAMRGGLGGLVLGAAVGALAAVAIQPVYYYHTTLDPRDQSLLYPTLAHAGMWGLVGAAGGIAMVLGLGGNANRYGRAALGGLLGGILGAVAFDLIGGFYFMEAGTERPISLTSQTRLIARMLVAVLAALGTAALICGEPSERN